MALVTNGQKKDYELPGIIKNISKQGRVNVPGTKVYILTPAGMGIKFLTFQH